MKQKQNDRTKTNEEIRNDELKKIYFKKPKKKWKPASYSGQILSYNLSIKVSPKALDYHERLKKELYFLTFSNGYDTSLKVKYAQNQTYFESIEHGMFGKNFIYISDPNQGLLMLDKAKKAYLHLNKKNLEKPNSKIQKWKIKSKREIGKGKIVQVNIDLISPLRGVYKLYFLKSKKFKKYSRKVFETVFICPKEIAKYGINIEPFVDNGLLIKGELFLENETPKTPVSSFEVIDLLFEPYNDKDFSIPPRYKDFRTLNSREPSNGARTSPDPQAVLDTVRPGSRAASSTILHSFDDRRSTQNEANLEVPSHPNNHTCFHSDYHSRITRLIDQRFLDDVRYFVNAITRRLNSFSGTGEEIDINWLDQMESHYNSLDGGPGSGLFYILRDVTNNRCGLIDIYAQDRVRRMLVNGTILDTLSLPFVTEFQVNLIMLNSSILPSQRYAALGPVVQRALREAYINQRLAHIIVEYPSRHEFIIFHDLIKIILWRIRFDIDINNTSILTDLSIQDDSISYRISIPSAGGTALVASMGTPKYWSIAGPLFAGSWIACGLFPATCALIPYVWMAARFFGISFSAIGAHYYGLEIWGDITFEENDDNHDILEPSATMEMASVIHVSHGISIIPDPVQDIIVQIVAETEAYFNILLGIIKEQLETKFNDFLKKDLPMSFPARNELLETQEPEDDDLRYQLFLDRNEPHYMSNDNLYINSVFALNGAEMGDRLIRPFFIKEQDRLRADLLDIRNNIFQTNFQDPLPFYNGPIVGGNFVLWMAAWTLGTPQVARFYFGEVISQNYLNNFAYNLWTKGELYLFEYSAEHTDVLFDLLTEFDEFSHLRDLVFNAANDFINFTINAVSPPRIITANHSFLDDSRYATIYFDDLRLCVNVTNESLPEPIMLEFRFSAESNCKIGFGGVDLNLNQLNLVIKSQERFDIYFELSDAGLQIRPLQNQSYHSNVLTPSTVNYDIYGTVLNMLLRRAFVYAFESRDSDVIREITPIPGAGLDSGSPYQVYPWGFGAVQLAYQIIPFAEALFIAKGISGPITALFSGALDIDLVDESTLVPIRTTYCEFVP